MDEIIKRLKNKEDLSFEESKSVFESIMSGKVKEEQIHDFLTSSSAKGETSDEIAGGIYVLRHKATQVNVPDITLDTCGTGGDGKNTLNISTALSKSPPDSFIAKLQSLNPAPVASLSFFTFSISLINLKSPYFL